MFKLGIITDEVHQDFEEALKFAEKYNLDCVELRSAWEKNAFEFTEEDFAEIGRLLKKYNMPLVCISSPLFKCSINDIETVNKHLDGLKKLISASKTLGFDKIRCFDFFKEDGIDESYIIEVFSKAIELCESAGITLLLESEPSTNSYDCSSTARMVKLFNTPVVRALYEPGNNIYSSTDEVPFPDGYNKIKDIFCHVHIKDAIKKDGKTVGVAIGQGLVDYKGMMTELINSGFDGAVIFEPHYKPNGIMSEELLRNPQGSQISAMGDIASKECIIALNKIIFEIKG